MPDPATMSKLGFLSLDSTLDPGHQKAITFAREHATHVVGELRAHREGILSDPHINERGRQDRLRQGLAVGHQAIVAVFNGARKEITPTRDTAVSALGSRMWTGVDTNPDRLGRVQDRLFQVLQRDPVPSKFPTDATSGHALLLAGGKSLSLLSEMLRTSSLDDARLLVLAAKKADPLTRHMLGGPVVIDSLTAALTDRLVAEDPEAAKCHADIAAVDGLLSMVQGDEKHALEFAAKALGLPVESLNSFKPDPIKAAVVRKSA